MNEFSQPGVIYNILTINSKTKLLRYSILAPRTWMFHIRESGNSRALNGFWLLVSVFDSKEDWEWCPWTCRGDLVMLSVRH